MSAPETRDCQACGDVDLPRAEFPPSYWDRAVRCCRRCASGNSAQISPQQLPDRLPVPTSGAWEDYLRRDETRRAVWG